jgi:hypothetical protein
MDSKPLFDTKSIPAPENILATTAPHYSDIIAGPVFFIYLYRYEQVFHTKMAHKNILYFHSNHNGIMKRNV